ncbi:MAG: DUF1501 domain-containing protein [Planctomycetota bacterium]|jgi:hypothetical protein
MTHESNNPLFSRRTALRYAGSGFGSIALAGLMATPGVGASRARAAESKRGGDGLKSKAGHFKASAKRVIFLAMRGGPSHLDTFDYKPVLNSKHGGPTTIGRERGGARLMGSPFRFARHGQSGQWFSELFPALAEHADDLCFIKSMKTDVPNHPQAYTQMHTGSFQFVRPSLGAWTLYGLGAENENLPGFVTLNPPANFGGAMNYGSAFLPAICQGTKIGGGQIPALYAKFLGKNKEPGPPLRNLENAAGRSRDFQRAQLDLIGGLNRRKLSREEFHPGIEGAIESMELAFRMQSEVPDVLDISDESQDTMEMYGIGEIGERDQFGRQCLMARRMAEAGVRFVEITAPVEWDHHVLLQERLPGACEAVDRPIAGLLKDLKRRGLLDDTLVIWAGEFGRTPYVQSVSGRDHNHKGYTIWMAGGGVKGGVTYGATDDYGYMALENPVSIHDWHATVLHLLGLDHTRLTYNYGGRDFRLTNVYGDVVGDILA